ncbi:MAG: hypothetical protein V1798_08135 [Pseudomonadota bacterium]
MHILRNLLIRITVTAFLVSIVLFLVPKFVDVSPYQDRLLDRFSQSFRGHLAIARSEAEFFPHLGLKLYGVALDAIGRPGVSVPLLRTPRADLRMKLSTLLSPRKEFDLYSPSAELSVRPLEDGRPNLTVFLGSEPKPRPVRAAVAPKPRSSRVEQDIDRRSRELVAGNYRPSGQPKKQPKATEIDIPTYLYTPIPREEDRPSVFENNRLSSLRFGSMSVAVHFPAGVPSTFRLKNVRISPADGELRAEAWIEDPKAPLVGQIAACEGGPTLVPVRVAVTLRADRLSVESWSRAGGPSWSGQISWDGALRLASGTSSLHGTVANPICQR